MPIGWFDAFRDNGGPTWYGENRTPVVTDAETAAIAVIFGLLFIAFLLIFPGVRRERISSFIAVTLNLMTGAVILVCIYHPCWEMGSLRISAPYRSLSTEQVDAILGVKIGLSAVNITLAGHPSDSPGNHFSYNERFKFTEVKSMQEELGHGLKRGLPYPILSVIQYLSVDQASFVWGRHFRLAGYYTGCLLWLCFGVWLLGLMLLCLVPHAYSRCLISLGLGMCLSILVYGLSSCRNLRIPFPATPGQRQYLIPRFHWCFWLTLSNGVLCLAIGAIIRFWELKEWLKFATFLQIDQNDRHSCEDDADAARMRSLSDASFQILPVPVVKTRSHRLDASGSGSTTKQSKTSLKSSSKVGPLPQSVDDTHRHYFPRYETFVVERDTGIAGETQPSYERTDRLYKAQAYTVTPSTDERPTGAAPLATTTGALIKASSSTGLGPLMPSHRYNNDRNSISEKDNIKRSRKSSSSISSNPYSRSGIDRSLLAPQGRRAEMGIMPSTSSLSPTGSDTLDSSTTGSYLQLSYDDMFTTVSEPDRVVSAGVADSSMPELLSVRRHSDRVEPVFVSSHYA